VLALAGQQVLAEGLPADPPAALVMNMHITGLAVARSLGRQGVPVVGLDDERGGLGQSSRHLAGLGLVPSPTDDEALTDHLLALGPSFASRPVLIPTNDDWVLALARHRDRLEEHYRYPFAPYDVVRRALSKTELYRACEQLGVAIPRTWYLDEAAPEQVASAVPYPCVLKPDDSRGFYNAFRAKVFVVQDPAEFVHRCGEAAAAGLTLVAQEWVDTEPGGFWSVASYLSPDGTPRASSPGASSSSGRRTSARPAWPTRGGTQHRRGGRDGAAGAGLQRDQRDRVRAGRRTGRQLLLDVNTRAWKWVGLPVAAGVDLPLLAYRDAVGQPFDSGRQRDGVRWTFLRDYLPLVKARAATVPEAQVTKAEWTALLAGRPATWWTPCTTRTTRSRPTTCCGSELSGGSGYRCAC
jgi:predicted ATP-grasp superfamily ATP-dependent carboligase